MEKENKHNTKPENPVVTGKQNTSEFANTEGYANTAYDLVSTGKSTKKNNESWPE